MTTKGQECLQHVRLARHVLGEFRDRWVDGLASIPPELANVIESLPAMRAELGESAPSTAELERLLTRPAIEGSESWKLAEQITQTLLRAQDRFPKVDAELAKIETVLVALCE